MKPISSRSLVLAFTSNDRFFFQEFFFAFRIRIFFKISIFYDIQVDKALQSIEEEAERIYKDERGMLLADESSSVRDSMYVD